MNKIILYNYTELPNTTIMHLANGSKNIDTFETKNGIVLEYIIDNKKVIVDYIPRNYGLRVNVFYKMEG